MSRAYTIEEIDDLREVLRDRIVWGTCCREAIAGSSGSYRRDEMERTAEDQLRTAMLAGHTADDFRAADRERWYGARTAAKVQEPT